MQTEYYTLELLSSYMITPDVKHFIFKMPSETFHYLPGQFITIYFEYEGKSYHRSYSIANAPGESTIEFAAGLIPKGIGSEF